jgi:hypothetical protein
MPNQPGSQPKQPPTEPKSFQTPQTPESRDLDKRDQAAAKGSGAHPDDLPDEADPHTEEQLDHGLKETFPASDPVSINPGAD